MRAAPSPLIIGHRGASGYRPEHTSAAYELAFALGADAVEPDIVATRDGVLVLRHENDVSVTTDVASRPEFAGRRTTKRIDGAEVTGWFTEDFSWDELKTLRACERLGPLRSGSATFDGRFPIMRLSELFELIDRASERSGRSLGMVAEIKHATYFESIGLPLDELFAAAATDAGWGGDRGRLVVESFERTVLGKVRARGIMAKRVYLIEPDGAPADEVAAHGAAARRYTDDVTEEGLFELATAIESERVDGISVAKSLVLDASSPDGTTDLVDRAHGAGLGVFCWTLRPENAFLAEQFRHGTQGAAWGDWRGEFELLIDSGVDGVFTDQPDLVADVRASR
ncbi:MAG TPA: glycerophosphodiester phosphodiesterase family protein [Humibacter sp.]|jgi:glycerophosphoryl diester phosphodiesterase|nr:glycerophosphodiester phosphodiesterase family protein [Humibacter sp.]